VIKLENARIAAVSVIVKITLKAPLSKNPMPKVMFVLQTTSASALFEKIALL
jgi:hypothetical protein